MSKYNFNPDTLERTTQLLYDHIPEFYKTKDRLAQSSNNPLQGQDLRELTKILSVPLAAVRQSIEEMFADYFVDTAGEDILPLIAENIALNLVFKDPDANRRDLGNAIFRRRHKGKPGLLFELATTLSDRLVALQEGWKHVQLCQDLNILRLSRTTPDLRAPSNQHRGSGPTSTIARTVDIQPITKSSGIINPRHVAYWTSISEFYPLRQATPYSLPDGDGDFRFAFDRNNDWKQLRARSTSSADTLKSDKILEGFFAEDPGAWLNVDGRFGVQIAGLPVGTSSQQTLRNAIRIPADDALIKGDIQIDVVEYDHSRLSTKMDIELHQVRLGSGNLPNTSQTRRRKRVTLSTAGITSTGPEPTNLGGNRIPMLKISPNSAVQGHIGATILSISSINQNSIVASSNPDLATSGYLSGSLYVRIPEMQIDGDCWFYIGADGSLHRAYSALGINTVDIPLEIAGPNLVIKSRLHISQPIGPVWPESPETQNSRPFGPPLPSMFTAPVMMHGLKVLRPSANALIGNSARNAIVFGISYQDTMGQKFDPILRLTWKGGDPFSSNPSLATIWQVVNANGKVSQGGKVIPIETRYAALAELIEKRPIGLALAYRFESRVAGAILTPGEIAFTSMTGDTILVHIPQLTANAPNIPEWPRGHTPIKANSIPLQVGIDGSSWVVGSNICKRKSLGQIAPIREARAYRCHEINWRRLCAWQNETSLNKLAATMPNRLDIDPENGLFAISKSNRPQDYHPGPIPAPGSNSVSVTVQKGGTMPLGAMPVDRHRVLNKAPLQATRFISKRGILSDGIDSDRVFENIYSSLAEAFAAISSDPLDHEIIRFEDSSTYPEGTLIWPENLVSLSIFAAENESPLITVNGSNPGAAAYESLFISGVAISIDRAQPVASPLLFKLPKAQKTRLTFISVNDSDCILEPVILEASGEERITIERCTLSQLKINEAVNLYISDTIIDSDFSGSIKSIDAPDAVVFMDRSTIIGPAHIEEAHITDSIIQHPLSAKEQFKGCIRFSSLAPGGQTPRKYRVIRTHPDLGIPIRPLFVSLDRQSPAYLRLRENVNPFLETAASNLGEVGVFNKAEIKETLKGMTHRIAEHSPAGLISGVIRQE